jgi:hypothetical protein
MKISLNKVYTYRRKVLFFFIMFIFMFVLVEGISLLACIFFQSKGVIYRPHLNKEYLNYLVIRDSALGWPNPNRFGHDSLFDISGSRISPSFSDPAQHKALISLYGDSFTFGDQVDNKHAWGNVLSGMLQERVSNYGVSGYGSDQAFLRFLKNTGDEAKIVFLNHLSENIIRNINQYRQLLYAGDGLGFKPRFIIQQNGSLELIPIPGFSEAEYPEVVSDPGSHLPYEYFVPNGPAGIQKLSFPYTLTLLKSFGNFHIRAKLRHVPWYAEFYDPDHPSHALDLTLGILIKFHEEAIARGKTPIVTVIPDEPDLVFFRKSGIWPYQSLIDGLKSRNIDVLNFGEGIMRNLGSDDVETLYKSGHYNERGNRIMADIALEYLQKKALLLQPDTTQNDKADSDKTLH